MVTQEPGSWTRSEHYITTNRGQPGADLAVVIVTYNSAYVLDAALASLQRLLSNCPVVVVDNGSSDDTIAIAENRGVHHVLSGHGNIGYGAAVNLGIRTVASTSVLVINPDVVIESVDQAELGALLEVRPLGLVSCTKVDSDRSDRAVMALWNWWHELLWMLWTWFLKPRSISARRPSPRSGRPGWISGAAFLASTAEWHTIGGFDESLFLYYEDVDLSRRYQSASYRLRATDAISISHVRREEERGADLELVQSWVFRSLVQMTYSWRGAKVAARAVAAVLLGLRIVEALGEGCALVPVLRRFGGRKAAGARAVLRALAQDPPVGPSSGHYPFANAAYSVLQGTGTSFMRLLQLVTIGPGRRHVELMRTRCGSVNSRA
jgi:N-acetylglucosaminyl-diphospho-decaprenol L-rhamnosyltransferase